MFEPIREVTKQPKIKIIGVGGGGGNAINHLAKTSNLSGTDIELFAVNTDAQVLQTMDEKVQTVQIGANITKGLG